jgi:hypothetical protein
MNNSEYLYSIGVVNAETHEKCRKAMDKYGDNHWWEEGMPPQVLAYYQMHEPIMLVHFGRFHGAVEQLIAQPVVNVEFAHPEHSLYRRVDAAWEKYQAEQQ